MLCRNKAVAVAKSRRIEFSLCNLFACAALESEPCGNRSPRGLPGI